MNTPDTNICQHCGAVIPERSTRELCPACLMAGALEATGGADGTVSVTTGESLSRHEPTEFPSDFGDYRLLGLLGRGGMGTVFEAEETATGRRVALKMLGQQLDSPELRQRFLREGRLAAGVNHPNSLYIFGSEEIEGLPVITMEIAGSGTLKDKLKKRGPLPVTEAVDAILDVITGLEAAFAGGVLHRDIKPSNCFVSPDGSVKVGDFGLSVSTMARFDTFITVSGQIMGTPAYAPPEQLRGDTADIRADIYSVGATLFTLLTGRAPFEGENVVQIVANAINNAPRPLTELREDVPAELERIVTRCLAKEPEGRYSDYMELRNALLPFSSREPEPASLKVRAASGWIDYLAAFLVPYAILMLAIGNEQFHLGFLMERTLPSAIYYLTFLGCGILYFTLAEGIWGGGFGKRFKGLAVVRADGRPPGIGRALIRILVPILTIEGIRMPILLATISATTIDGMTTPEIVIFSVATSLCPMIPALFNLSARRENGFATLWDLASGTRVVVRPKGVVRPSIDPLVRVEDPAADAEALGPYLITDEIVPGEWVAAIDPVLRRRVWLLRRTSSELAPARRDIARQGRLRWLQKVERDDITWDAYEAIQGMPFSELVADGNRLPWATLRHLLHDLASELWSATGDQTLPAELSLDHVWVTALGNAILLDEPWPDAGPGAERIPVGDLDGQQQFLGAIASFVESTGLPLHARPVLRNLKERRFEKLSFLTGTLRGLLDRPAEVSRGIRAGSIFMIPLYTGIMIFVGTRQGADWLYGITGDSAGMLALSTAMFVLACSALIQLLEVPLRTTGGHSIFRLAVVNAEGERAGPRVLLARWAIAWLPLLIPVSVVVLLTRWPGSTVTALSSLAVLLLWLSAAFQAVIHPHRGLHDRLAGTWVVRQ
ncbi:protein kinase [Gemmatimonadota bacterium]